FIKDIIEEMPDPKPPYNSVSTIVRVLVKKEVLSFKQYGGSYQYYPLISKDEYSKSQMGKMVKNYFNNSFKQVVNFFSEEKNLDVDEVEEVMKLLEEIKKKKTQNDE
ncbi:MAG: BlaI/MecI/CopY family transcriptional regulator, partial [Bacteroidales bacterium]|nr:BlaI/MecI/CopY family transcriptional regulator [Bacteroidales bacterium]